MSQSNGINPDNATSSTTSKRSRMASLAVTFVAGLAIGGLVIGGVLQATKAKTGLPSTDKLATSISETSSERCSTTFNVVASVNQWGSLAQELGGACAQVTSLINSTAADPHDYEATPADLAKLSKADIVVLNGAGYDGWAEKAQLDPSKQTIVNVGDIMGITATEEHSHEHEEGEGHHHHHGSVNPHLWFSPEAVLNASQAITSAYVDRAGGNSDTAATAQRHSNEWNADYADFVALVNEGRSQNLQRRYVATESIISYLLEYTGAVDHTPATYTNAMNNDAEPSAADLKSALDTVSGPDVDILVINPQEMGGFAQKLNDAATAAGKTIVSVTEQLPENQKTLLGWLTVIAHQVMANDTMNGWFLTQDVKDRSLSDYTGDWQSAYPLLQNGSLKKVMEAKAKTGDMTEDEYTKYYDTGYKTDVDHISINGSQITFTRGDKTATATYEYSGYKILDYAKGNRGVRFLFTATGDVPDGAPKAVQFSDHGIAPGKAAHFHIFMSDSQENGLKELNNWPTYYPASMSADEVATEMLAH